jgi:hypothetical protein
VLIADAEASIGELELMNVELLYAAAVEDETASAVGGGLVAHRSYARMHTRSNNIRMSSDTHDARVTR